MYRFPKERVRRRGFIYRYGLSNQRALIAAHVVESLSPG